MKLVTTSGAAAVLVAAAAAAAAETAAAAGGSFAAAGSAGVSTAGVPLYAQRGDRQRAATFLVSPGGAAPFTLDLDAAIAKASSLAFSSVPSPPSSSSSSPASTSQRSAVVRLLPGVYSLRETLRFDSMNPSARFSADAPLVIESADSRDPAVLSGGVELTSWTVGPEPWQWVAQLPVNATAANVSSLWVNGQRRGVARTSTVQYADSTADNVTLAAGTLPQPLTDAPGLRAVIYHCWTASYHAVSAVSKDGLAVSLSNPQNTAFNGNTQATGKRVYFEGHPAFLTNGSGTFVVDAAANTVTYAPTTDELAAHPAGPANMSVIAPQLVELLRMDNDAAAGVVIRNVNFSYAAADFAACLAGTCDAQSAAFLETAALHFENATALRLQNVGISHVDGNGVWVGAGSRNVSMDRLHVSDVGAGGVRIGASIGGVSGDARADQVSLTNSVLENGGTTPTMGAARPRWGQMTVMVLPVFVHSQLCFLGRPLLQGTFTPWDAAFWRKRCRTQPCHTMRSGTFHTPGSVSAGPGTTSQRPMATTRYERLSVPAFGAMHLGTAVVLLIACLLAASWRTRCRSTISQRLVSGSSQIWGACTISDKILAQKSPTTCATTSRALTTAGA